MCILMEHWKKYKRLMKSQREAGDVMGIPAVP
jgi:hypothetical protein